MNVSGIIQGIYQAPNAELLTAHLDSVGRAIDRNECDYDNAGWHKIEAAIRDKTEKLGILAVA